MIYTQFRMMWLVHGCCCFVTVCLWSADAFVDKENEKKSAILESLDVL